MRAHDPKQGARARSMNAGDFGAFARCCDGELRKVGNIDELVACPAHADRVALRWIELLQGVIDFG